MRAGQLRETVTIQAMTPANDPVYGQTETPVTVDTVPAAVEGKTGEEILKDEGVTASTSFDVTMRYRSDVTSANRLVWNGQALEILSVVNDPKRTTLNIVAKLIV